MHQRSGPGNNRDDEQRERAPRDRAPRQDRPRAGPSNARPADQNPGSPVNVARARGPYGNPRPVYGPRRDAPGPARADRNAGQVQGPAHGSWVHTKILQDDGEVEAHYIQTKFLGEGGYGQAWEVIPVQGADPMRRLAMKIQPKHDEFAQDPTVEYRRLYKELLVMNRILPRHKNIVQIEDCLISPDNVYLVTELCAPMKMLDFFEEADETSARRVFQQLAETVHFMHQYGVFHYDLSEDNVLFADNDYTEIKIIDFGISVYCPEMAQLHHREFNPRHWLDEADITPARNLKPLFDEAKLGNLLLSILAMQQIGFGRSGLPIVQGKLITPRKDVFSEKALDLLAQIGPRMYGPDDPRDGLPVERILQHPWLTGANLNQPILRDVEREFALLRTDWSLLGVLLRDRNLIIPLKVLFTDGELRNHYHVLGSLQRGGVNTPVMECEDAPAHSARYEMEITRRNPDGIPEDETARALRLYNELLVALRILPRHQGIARIHDVLVHRQFVVVIKEPCGRQTLLDFLPFARNNPGKSQRIFKQIAETVHFMHRYGVTHNDLQPHHIVFTDTQFTNCKIVNLSKAGFQWGLASEKHENFQANKWIPPEVCLMFHEVEVTNDVRALGNILHAMMVGVWEPIYYAKDADVSNIRYPPVGVFDQNCQNLLSRIGPVPFGPLIIPILGQNGIHPMDTLCLHPWLAGSGGAGLLPLPPAPAAPGAGLLPNPR